MKGLVRVGIAAAAVVVGLLGFHSVPATATHVSCGDTITQDTTLDSDLINCPGDGVLIGAPNITLDLGGHVIDGSNPAPFFGADLPPDGVSDRAGFSGVTIRNGRVQEFQQGIDFGGFRSGIGETPSSDNAVRRVTISGPHGVTAWDTTRLVIEQNEISAIEPMYIVGLHGGSDATISENRITVLPPATRGLLFVGGLPDSTFDHNTVEDMHTILNSNDSVVSRNLVRSGDDGIAIGADGNVVSRNVVTGNQDGLFIQGTNLIEKNDSSSNSRNGIFVQSGQPRLLHNKTNGNLANGIEVHSPGTFLAKNRAERNGDFGIVAVPGVIDGGGNNASGNGNPLQCLNVFCK